MKEVNNTSPLIQMIKKVFTPKKQVQNTNKAPVRERRWVYRNE